jgi:hypothetical protein
MGWPLKAGTMAVAMGFLAEYPLAVEKDSRSSAILSHRERCGSLP